MTSNGRRSASLLIIAFLLLVAGCGPDGAGDPAQQAAPATPASPPAETASAGSDPYTIAPVFYYGDAAPGATTFYYFGMPGLTRSGKIFFAASVFNTAGGGSISPHGGIWAGTPGNFTLYIREGDPAPGVGGGNALKYLHDLILNDAGQLAFHSSFEDPDNPTGYNTDGVWSGRPASWNLIAKYGDPAPGTADGYTWVAFGKSLGFSTPWISDAGKVAFYGRPYRSDPCCGYDSGIWANMSGSLERVASSSDVTEPAVNAAGDFAYFSSSFSGQGSQWRNVTARVNGQTETVASQGGSVPGLAATFHAFLLPLKFSDGGHVGFTAQLNDSDEVFRNDRGLFVGQPGDLQLLVQGGDPSAGVPGGNHQACCAPDVNENGVAAFFDFIGGEGIGSEQGNNEGIWMGTPGNLSLVARAGDLVPGATGDVRFSRFSHPLINKYGKVAFLVILKGDDVPNYGTFGTESLWVGTPGNLHMIAMEGDEVQVNSGESLPLKEIEFPTDDNRRGLDDVGHVLFRGTFEGPGTTLDRTGIFLATPPVAAGPTANAGADQTVEATSPEGAAVTLHGGGSRDPSGGTALTYQWQGPFGTAGGVNPTVTVPLGTYTVTLTVTATGIGTTDADTVSVTVQDTTAPSLTAPGNIDQEATAFLSPVALGTPTVSDLADPNPTVTRSPAGGSFPVATTVVTWTATDASGNVAMATQSVTIRDTTPPEVTAPPDLFVYATGPLTVVELGAASAYDLVDGALTPTPEPAGPFAPGLHTVTWSASDAHGNEGSAEQQVAVGYDFGGFLTPIRELPAINAITAGRTVPVKWQIRNPLGGYIGDLSVVTGMMVALPTCSAGDTTQGAVATGHTTLRYDPTAEQYVFNWKTGKEMAGQCAQFILSLNDGSTHTARFQLR